MAAQPTSAAKESSVAYNGNNKNGNGNGSTSVIGVANLASTGVLLLAIFGLWWQTADPRARIDKIESNIVDTRKELNEGLNNIRKELPDRYVTQREHADLQTKVSLEVENAHKTHDSFLTKSQFDAWKIEKDVHIADIVKRMDWIGDDVREIRERTIPREEFSASLSTLKDRLDQLYALYRETQKAFHDTEMRNAK